MEHDAYTSKLYKENWDDAVEKLNEADRFLEDALNALNWQGGTRHQVLKVIAAARDIASERKQAELTGCYDDLPKYLDALESCFNT